MAEGNQIYCPQTEQNIVTYFNIIDSSSNSTDAFYIQISTGYILGEDQLILTGDHPNISSSWDASQAKLSMIPSPGNDSINYNDLINAVNNVMFFSNNINVDTKTFSLTIGEANFLNGHYYEFIPSPGIAWTAAEIISETMTYYGLQGYLATITSASEAQICGELTTGTGWIGANDAEDEGVWKWVTGPEEGMIFWNGNENGSSPPGVYSNWNTGEPNNVNNEDYAHITDESVGFPGSWNDLPNATNNQPPQYTATGFVVEYGGMDGDPELNISASTTLRPPEILSTTPANGCENEIITLEATSNTSEIIWFDDQFAGNQLHIGNTYGVELIDDTTYWVLASENNCSNGLRVPINANLTPNIPTVFSQIEDICEGSSINLPTTSNNDITGTWSPEFDPNNTTTYTFTPDDGQCASAAEMTITIQTLITPVFSQIEDICFGETPPDLPLISNNGIEGTWSPSIVDNTQTNNYTFSTNEENCIQNVTMTITVNDLITPTFNIDDICIGQTIETLPEVSNEGISGTWSPSINNLITTTYLFTPDIDQCASSVAEIVEVNSFNNLEVSVENISNAFDTNQIIEIIVSGGSGNYAYQLDDGLWQDSPVFQNVVGCNEHLVRVKDYDGCSNEPEKSFNILDYPKFFTPNGDGFNDFWNIKCLDNQTAIISIFNREGKLLRILKTTSPGWNGTYNGKILPNNDYWFTVEYTDNGGNKREFSSHFTLRR
tara:strand:- start:74120 stop:76282 length:2163 start_codon:yes stop_codon:yes gene_type:complete